MNSFLYNQNKERSNNQINTIQFIITIIYLNRIARSYKSSSTQSRDITISIISIQSILIYNYILFILYTSSYIISIIKRIQFIEISMITNIFDFLLFNHTLHLQPQQHYQSSNNHLYTHKSK